MDAPPYVPYQAYKSKKHSRNVSNPQNLAQTASWQRPQSIVVPNGHARSASLIRRENETRSFERLWNGSPIDQSFDVRPASSAAAPVRHERNLSVPTTTSTASSGHTSPSDPPSTPSSIQQPETPTTPLSPPIAARSRANSLAPTPLNKTTVTPTPPAVTPIASGSSTVPSSPLLSDRSLPQPKKTSTFRHVAPRQATGRSPMPSSPLRPQDAHSRTASIASMVSRQLEQPSISRASSSATESADSPSATPSERALPPIPSLELTIQSSMAPSQASAVPTVASEATVVTPSPHHPVSSNPPPRTSSLVPPSGLSSGYPSPYPNSSPTEAPSPSPATPVSRSRNNIRQAALYRPGFQPKGVYRPRTDDFLEARKHARDVGRIERTRLERRLEKLINLHFPSEERKQKEEMSQATLRPLKSNRRLSSIWDLDLRSKSAGDLFKEVMQSQAPPGTKGDIREQEKTITPWEDDASVSQCPLCGAGFHPLTNRKHHCRLCGRIICSLPVKYPQRPQTCSLLFVADPKTGKIEEVGEGVDYGVRRRPAGPDPGRRKDAGMSEEEKFLKGVRICRDCRPVLLRQQLKQEALEVPVFSRLYTAFIILEKEIEDSLPAFQELMLSLSKHECPTPEAMAARKRLLDAFAQYDVLAKRIRQLPCAERNMFPLQALPKPEKASKSKAASAEGEQVIDPDSEVMHVLQPLLEQEALLETFVEEAKAHRKFEDAKTLKANLREIRTEIERALASAEGNDPR